MTLTKLQREQVRTMFGGRCAYCGCELPEKGWHADHVEPVVRDSEHRNSSYENGVYKHARVVRNGKVRRPENNRIENIYPACRACNIDKGSDSLQDWRSCLEGLVPNNLRKYIPNFRHAERFGRVIEVAGPVVFWFEQWASEKKEIAE